MAWASAGYVTNTSANDTQTFSVSNSETFMFLGHMVDDTSNGVQMSLRFNNDANNTTNYNYVYSTNGATATGTSTSGAPYLYMYPSTALVETFTVGYIVNIETEEKLFIYFTMSYGGSGSGVVPARREFTGKWNNTTAVISSVTNDNTHTGNFDTGSNISFLGSELTPVAETVTLQDGTIFEETDTNKSYIWNATSQTWTQL